MATELTSTVLTNEFEGTELVFTDVVSAETSEYYYVPFDNKGVIELIVDASASEADVTLALSPNSFTRPSAERIVIEIPAGEIKAVAVSSGKTILGDGCMYFAIKAESALTALGIKLAAIKRRFVTNN